MYNTVLDASKANPIDVISIPRQDCAKEFGILIDGKVNTQKMLQDSACFNTT
jgi:hypothetical protein